MRMYTHAPEPLSVADDDHTSHDRGFTQGVPGRNTCKHAYMREHTSTRIYPCTYAYINLPIQAHSYKCDRTYLSASVLTLCFTGAQNINAITLIFTPATSTLAESRASATAVSRDLVVLSCKS